MNSSIILKKENHWYVIPAGSEENTLILGLLGQENPELLEDSELSFAERLAQEGWSIEEYRDFAIVA